MEGVLLTLFGGDDGPVVVHHPRPQSSIADLDQRLSYLQANALDRSRCPGLSTFLLTAPPSI